MEAIMKVTFLVFENHGYLKAPKKSVQYTPSTCSYWDEDFYYLEEDCDATAFQKQMEKTGEVLIYNEQCHDENSHDYFDRKRIESCYLPTGTVEAKLHTETPTKQKRVYSVEITETLSRVIEIEANSETEAQEEIQRQYKNKDIILTSYDDFQSSNIEVII